jgi:iron(III) transport system substrate-binding protein
MRRLLVLVVLALTAACAPQRPPTPGTSASVAGARQPLVIYSPHGDEVLKPFKERFAAAHPEIEVTTIDMGAQGVLDRLRAEQANPGADLWWGAPHTMFAQAADLGLLEPYQPTWSAQLDAAKRDPQHRWYGQYVTPVVAVYNSTAIQPDAAPRDWDDLLAEKWKGKILLRDPKDSGTMRTFIAAMILRQPSVDAGYAWLRKLDANTVAYPASPALLFRQLQAQEGVLTPWNLRDYYIQRRDHGYQLGLVLPASGSPLILDGIALVKGGRHLAAAKVFYEFVTAPEQLAWAAERFYCLPARGDVDPARLPADMPKTLRELKLDWARIRAEGDAWQTHWSEQIKGKGGA